MAMSHAVVGFAYHAAAVDGDDDSDSNVRSQYGATCSLPTVSDHPQP